MFYGRGLNKVRNPYLLKDIYNYYSKGVEKDGPFNISYSLYREIIEEYLKLAAKKIFEGRLYRMPAGLGSVSIVKIKMKYDLKNTLTPDWANTIKFGKLIRHLNEHSKGFKYRFHWYKKGINFNSEVLYRLVMTRYNKRELARIIKLGEIDYIQLK
jgi:hypothetical protein